MKYEELMLRAITNANAFKYLTKPNPVVGAILSKNGEIISEGYHEEYGKNHAEINAISNAQKLIGKKFKDFSELTLICSLEPCSHIEKTGSCAEAIGKSGIKKVVIGSKDPNPKVCGKGIKILEKNKINVITGIHEKLVEKQNKFFFFKHKNKKPFITLKIASSMDGKSHFDNGKKTIITTKDSRKDVHLIRASHDAILTGGNTLRIDNPKMNARVNFLTNQPRKILLTQKKINREFKFFDNADVKIFKIRNLNHIVNSIGEDDICSVLVEAGPMLANAFLRHGLVDEIIVYKSKKNLGEKGVNWFNKENAIENYGFKLESSYKIDTDIKKIFIKNEQK